eukprot:7501027-Alexandrium_andersonii.AAC.1
MSASLVGSEMCIRDRLGRARQSWAELRRGRGCSGQPRAALTAPARVLSSCLLYTSDAADDM